MRYRNSTIVCVVMLLVLSIFTNNVLAEACLCGQACLHGLRAKARTNVHFLFHLRCSDIPCKSCNLEKGQTLKAIRCASLTPNVKIFYNSTGSSSLFNSPCISHFLKDFELVNGLGATPFSPIYIQKNSLLC